MRNYERIDAWQLADLLAFNLYRASARFPQHEIQGLTSQLRRAAVSVAANIAEGSARESSRDYRHFLIVSRGSLTEAHYLCRLAEKLEYLNLEQSQSLEILFRRTFACLHALIAAVTRDTPLPTERRTSSPSEPKAPGPGCAGQP